MLSPASGDVKSQGQSDPGCEWEKIERRISPPNSDEYLIRLNTFVLTESETYKRDHALISQVRNFLRLEIWRSSLRFQIRVGKAGASTKP